jgi:hypothetical protein
VFLLFPSLLFVWKKKLSLRLLLSSSAVLFVLFLFICTRLVVVRYLGAILPLGAGLSLICLHQFWQEITDKAWASNLIVVAMAGVILWQSDFFVTTSFGMNITRDEPLYKSAYNLWRAPNAAYQIRSFHVSGGSRAWLRQNVKLGENVTLSTDSLSYYLPGMTASAFIEDRELDNAAKQAKDLLDLLPLLEAKHIHYILDSYNWFLASDVKISHLCVVAAKQFPDIVVFSDRDSNILDVEKLAKHKIP